MDWAIGIALHRPKYIRLVRPHVVPEPSKARVITVAPFAYMVIMNFFGHFWTKDISAEHLRGGLTADRHLWSFMKKTMDNDSLSWQYLSGTVYGLSTDLEEATDYGNPSVARQIWHWLILTSSGTLGFPTGLAVLAKSLFCGKRYVLQKGQIILKKRGWFMGDPMTKCILTLAQDYCIRAVPRYHAPCSVVGDDLVSLSSDRELLKLRLRELKSLDFRISRDDTFISKFFVYYCEEISLIPQRPSDTISVCYRRGTPLGYVDYPRLRLLLDTKVEMNRSSYTRTGRFLLLGKETQWCHILAPELYPIMYRASVWQHVLLPTDSDTLGRYLPQVIGGDGHHPGSIAWARRMWDNHPARSEIYFRLNQLWEKNFPARYLRSEHLHGVHAYHLWLPKAEKLRDVIPPDWIVDYKDDLERELLSSFKGRFLASPISAIEILAGRLYYREVLQGRDPVEMKFGFELEVGHTDLTLSDPQIGWILETWNNPGFFPKNREPYFIKSWELGSKNYLNYELQYVTRWDRNPSLADQLVDDLQESEIDAVMERVLQQVLSREYLHLGDRVMNRLYMFMESDNLLISILLALPESPGGLY